MSRDIQIGVAASTTAYNESGLTDESSNDRLRWGCISGAGIISVDQSEMAPAFADCSQDDHSPLNRWGNTSMQLLPPLVVLKYLPNMVSSHISIVHQLRGLSNTISCGEPSGHLAIGEAYNTIRRGSCDVIVCGGAESRVNITDLTYEVAKETKPSTRPSSPSSVVPGEGAGFLVLESLEFARQRRAAILAEITGFAVRQSVDVKPSRGILRYNSNGRIRSIASALHSARLNAEQLNAVFLSGCGDSQHRDEESKSIASFFGSDAKLPFIDTRPLFGNCYAGNSLDIAVAVLLVNKSIRGVSMQSNTTSTQVATSNFDDVKHALAIASNQEGQNVTIVISRFQ